MWQFPQIQSANKAKTCQICHNNNIGSHPDIPDRTGKVLSNFLPIDRFYSYIISKGKDSQMDDIINKICP